MSRFNTDRRVDPVNRFRPRASRLTHCSLVRVAISSLADNEESPLSRIQVGDHTRGCAPCLRFAEQVELIKQGVAVRSSKRPPLTLVAEVRKAAIDAGEFPRHVKQARGSGTKRWRDIAAVLAVVLACATAPAAAAARTIQSPTHVPSPCTSHLRLGAPSR
jgi:hypothetical protein